jgi:hypothetical protein
MSPLSVVLLTTAFVSVMIYFGNSYSKFHVNKQTWLIVTVIISIIFIAQFLLETFKGKKEE